MAGQIIRRGDRKWLLRWYEGRGVDGKRRYASKIVHGTKKQADQALRGVLSRQDRGLAVPSRVPTLSEFVKTWKQGEAFAKLRPATRRMYEGLLDRHVLPKLGHVGLNAIHTARIEAEIVAPLRHAGKLRTAQLAVVSLSKVMQSALKDPTLGLVGNPCRGVEVEAPSRRDVPPLTEEERAKFREAISGTKYEALFVLLMGTGLRPGEARALGWEHVDLEASEVRVERAVDDKGEFHPPKTEKSRRAVPLPLEVRQLLRERHLRAGRPASGLLFPGKSGGVLDQRNLLRRQFRPALERAEIPAARVAELRIYDLRHGFATAAARQDVRAVADLMGNSPQVVMDVYQHTTDERKRETAAEITRRLLGS